MFLPSQICDLTSFRHHNSLSHQITTTIPCPRKWARLVGGKSRHEFTTVYRVRLTTRHVLEGCAVMILSKTVRHAEHMRLRSMELHQCNGTMVGAPLGMCFSIRAVRLLLDITKRFSLYFQPLEPVEMRYMYPTNRVHERESLRSSTGQDSAGHEITGPAWL